MPAASSFLRSTAAAALLIAALSAAPAAAAVECRASAQPRNLRERGAAELLGDLRLHCTGGRLPAPGEQPAKYQIVVSADAPLTMRTTIEDELGAIAWTEALLLTGEPAPREQRPCVPDAEEIEQRPGSLDCGAAAGDANVFQALRLQDNAVVFRDAPIEPAAPGGASILRIVNLRADVRELGAPTETEPAGEVYLTVRIFGPSGETVPVELADQLAGRVTPSVAVEVRSADNRPALDGRPALLTTPSLTPERRPEDGPSFLIQFRELVPDAFRRRNAGSSGADPAFLVDQAQPGATPSAESGFFNGSFPSRRGLNRAGLADVGLRLRAVFEDVPDGVQLWFSYRDVASGTTGYDEDAPRARLTAGSGGAFRPLVPQNDQEGEFVEFTPADGRVEVFWEVTTADPQALETLSFEVGLTSRNGDAALGEATLLGEPAPGSTLESAMIPAFEPAPADAEPLPAFALVPTLPLAELAGVSAASYSAGPVAPGAIVAAFSSAFAAEPDDFRVELIDSSGALRPGTVLAVGPGQANIRLDPKTALGTAVATAYAGGRPLAQGSLEVVAVSPGLFAANGDGRGPAAGQWLRMTPDGETMGPLAVWDDAAAAWVPAPTPIEGGVHVTLYGSGFSRAEASSVRLLVDSLPVPVTFAGEQGEFPGLDQINAGPLPTELAGRGLVDVEVRIGSLHSNRLQLRLP